MNKLLQNLEESWKVLAGAARGCLTTARNGARAFEEKVARRITIRQDQRGLLHRDGDYQRLLRPGKHLIVPALNQTVFIVDAGGPFQPGNRLQLYLHDPELARELTVVDVSDHELALHFADNHLVELLTAGRYAYWKGLVEHRFQLVDLSRPHIPDDVPRALRAHPVLSGHIQRFTVASHECGLLYFDGELQGTLKPGRVEFWKGPTEVSVNRLDLRQQQLDITGQEVMTADKAAVRLNVVGHSSSATTSTGPKRRA